MKTILLGQLIWLTVYISFKLFQTLIYAWSGEKITSEVDCFFTYFIINILCYCR